MNIQTKLERAIKVINEHEIAQRTPGWDRRVEAAIVTVFGNGDPETGRETLVRMARQRLADNKK